MNLFAFCNNLIIAALIFLFPIDCFANEIIIGEKPFPEQYLLGGMVARLFKNIGLEVKEKPGLNTTELRKELEDAKVHAYWEYTGTGAFQILGIRDQTILQNAELLYQTVKQADTKNGIIWLNRTEINNGWVFLAKNAAPRTITELASAMNDSDMRIAILSNFYHRKDGFKAMARHYGFKVKKANLIFVSDGQAIGYLMRGNADIALGFGTDPHIKEFGFYVIEDDEKFFPVYNPVFTIREEVLNKHPQIRQIISSLVKHLDQETMIYLNHQVRFEGKIIEHVISRFLKEKGLL